jgi:low affinity Fe/Cu permease
MIEDHCAPRLLATLLRKNLKDSSMKRFHHAFTLFAKWTARMAGQPIAFVLAAATIIVWAVSRPLFTSFDTWHLVINTATTIVTFLMVFLIQNTQNRDTGAIQTKLDELIRAIEGAHNALLDLEELDEAEIEHIRRDYRNLAEEARKAIEKGRKDTDCQEVKHADRKSEKSRR